MSFAVLHMQKFKTNDVTGMQIHNQRERESKTNFDIDKSKIDLNYDLHNESNITFSKKIKDIIKENVITDRAIRKDAVVMCNFIITSDKKFFDNLSDLERERFFETSYKFFEERYGKEKIISSIVHLDEKTPHMHLNLVPVTEDKKLSAKRLFDRNELRALQDDFPKFLNENNFELKRGLDAEGKNKHIETQRFKKNQLESDLKALESKLNRLNDISIDFEKINSLEAKEKFLNKNVVEVNKDDFEELKNLAKEYYFISRDLKKEKDKNKELKTKIENKNKLNLENRIEFEKLKKENKLINDFVLDKNLINVFKIYKENLLRYSRKSSFKNEKTEKDKTKKEKNNYEFER